MEFNQMMVGRRVREIRTGDEGTVSAHRTDHVDKNSMYIDWDNGERLWLYINEVQFIDDKPALDVHLSKTEREALQGLIKLAMAAFYVADDSEDDGSGIIKVEENHMRELGEALDQLDELPDDQPGYSMGPANKAAWALRRLI